MASNTPRPRLRTLRKSANLTQEDLGNELGLTQGVVSRLELGEIPFHDGYIGAYMDRFGCSSDWLLGKSRFGGPGVSQ